MSKSKDVAKNYQQVSLFQREEGKKLIDDLEIHRGHVILDLGCGTGELSAYLSELVGQDGRVVAGLGDLRRRIFQLCVALDSG